MKLAIIKFGLGLEWRNFFRVPTDGAKTMTEWTYNFYTVSDPSNSPYSKKNSNETTCFRYAVK